MKKYNIWVDVKCSGETTIEAKNWNDAEAKMWEMIQSGEIFDIIGYDELLDYQIRERK